MNHPLSIRAVRLLAAMLLLSACADTQPTRFYTLSGLLIPPADQAPGKPSPGVVGVGPVTLPAYVDRPQVVRRASANQVMVADFDTWIEPLDAMVPRVLAENLSLLLGTDEVWLLPQRRPMRLDYQVEVDVSRFDADGQGNAILDARWRVYGRDGDQLLASRRATIVQQAAASDGLTGVVAAMSQALGRLSHEIAEALQAAHRQRRAARTRALHAGAARRRQAARGSVSRRRAAIRGASPAELGWSCVLRRRVLRRTSFPPGKKDGRCRHSIQKGTNNCENARITFEYSNLCLLRRLQVSSLEWLHWASLPRIAGPVISLTRMSNQSDCIAATPPDVRLREGEPRSLAGAVIHDSPPRSGRSTLTPE